MGFNWERYEAWRKHPMLSNNLRHSLPGLGIATVAFGVFVAYDKLLAGHSGGHH
jgi:NADH dehydrogenase (ubiquinone) 1 beta subcomplex subunit 3